MHEFFTVNEVDYNESYTEVNTEINIRALCEGTHFCYLESSRYGQASIAFTKRPHLPDGVKIIMLSATANVQTDIFLVVPHHAFSRFRWL